MPPKSKLRAYVLAEMLRRLDPQEVKDVLFEMDKPHVERWLDAIEKRLNPDDPHKPATC